MLQRSSIYANMFVTCYKGLIGDKFCRGWVATRVREMHAVGGGHTWGLVG